MIITEKIDGTNAAIGIVPAGTFTFGQGGTPGLVAFGKIDDAEYVVYAQSRKRLITPDDDNYGFARWVCDNAIDLVPILGPGLHFGEWWGQGIQRNYGLDHRRFSLFNTSRWGWLNDPQAREAKAIPDQLWSVPVLMQHTFATTVILETMADLYKFGSSANPGFMKPEGIVVYHTAANVMFKQTFEGDAEGKGNG
jgi:hypothetical protein